MSKKNKFKPTFPKIKKEKAPKRELYSTEAKTHQDRVKALVAQQSDVLKLYNKLGRIIDKLDTKIEKLSGI